MDNSLQKQVFSIGNVHCSSCEGKVIRLLTALDGVEEVLVNVLRKKMYVTFDSQKVAITAIQEAMQKAGYTATPLSSSDAPAEEKAPLTELASPFTMAPPASVASTDSTASASQKIQNKQDTPPLQEQAFLLHKVHCASCQGKIHAALMELCGIEEATVNTLRRSVVVKYNPALTCPASILTAFTEGKYKLQEVSKNELPPLIPSIQDVKQRKVSSLQKMPAKAEAESSAMAQNATVEHSACAAQNAPQPSGESPKKKQEQSFKIGNVHCTSCEDRVQKLLSALGGVHEVQVNLLRKTMLVRFDASCIDAKGIAAAMEGAGYTAAPIIAPTPDIRRMDAKPQSTAKQESTPEKDSAEAFPLALCLSLFMAAVLMYVAMGPMFSLPLPAPLQGQDMHSQWLWAISQALLCLPILLLHKNIFISGFRALLQKSPNMDSLVGLGSGSATIFGVYALVKIYLAQNLGHANTVDYYSQNLYFDSAGMILALIGLGKFFESKARNRAGSAIDALMRLSPPTALCLRNGKEVTIATEEIRPDDILVVYAGESLAADGIIVHGHAFIDTSVITGESLPQEKKVGDSVIGATVSQSGYFHMRVTKAGADSTLAHIIELVESATASKAPIARLADKISAIFVPIIIIIALITFGVWLGLGYSLEFALSAAISVLVISCPCALGLATPTAIMVGMGLGAEKGILFKSAVALERLQAVDTVILDKTGTITHGKPTLTDIFIPTTSAMDENTLLRLAASMESLSEHPLGKAIVRHAEEKELSLLPKESFENFSQLPGLGIMAQLISDDALIPSGQILAGNARFLTKENKENPLLDKEKEWARQGKTVLYFCHNDTLLGLIAVADTVKESSKNAVQHLKSLGLNVLMLTGDNAQTAKVVQQQVDIENIMAEVLPQEKAAHVQKLEESGHKVAMVGDGINDAPALASAHVGIAIGAGTDIAIQSADIVLMQSDVLHVAAAMRLSKAVMRAIKQNLFWAFAYNIILIPVAAGLFSGFGLMLSPMLAAASMSISSLTVVGNALRLRLQKKSIF